MLNFHRKEQFDIVVGGIKKPLLVIGWKTPDSYSLLFCVWSGGVWLRLWGKHRLCWQWSKLVAYVEAWFNAGKVAWCVEPPNKACTRPPFGVGMRRRFGKLLVRLGNRLIQNGGG